MTQKRYRVRLDSLVVDESSTPPAALEFTIMAGPHRGEQVYIPVQLGVARDPSVMVETIAKGRCADFLVAKYGLELVDEFLRAVDGIVWVEMVNVDSDYFEVKIEPLVAAMENYISTWREAPNEPNHD